MNESFEAGYAQGVENTEARAVARIGYLERKIDAAERVIDMIHQTSTVSTPQKLLSAAYLYEEEFTE